MYSTIMNDYIKNNLLRTIQDKESPQGKIIKVSGKEFINFSSNDYLGLASHINIINAVKNAISIFGCGAGASRLLSGGCTLHNQLEKKIALLKGSEYALLYSSGYSANIGAISALTSRHDALFSDELNHASIIDGCRLSKAARYIFKHRDTAHLSKLIQSVKQGKKMVITESVFSMDGDIAPLNEIYEICKKYSALLYIDDAHATGVMGKGRGSLEHFGLKAEDFIIQMGTFSKALGSSGGFIAASRNIVDYLINASRSLIYSTALPVPAVSASLASLNHIEKHSELIEKLKTNISLCRNSLLKAGFKVTNDDTPIIPILFSSIEETLLVSRYLFDHGIYAPAIRPPTVKMPRLRISISASHEQEDIEYLVHSLKKAAECILH